MSESGPATGSAAAQDTTARYVRNHDVFFTLVDGELIIMDGDEEKFFASNAVAAALWEQLASPASLAALCDAVLARFAGASADQVASDIAEFLAALEGRGLVERTA